MYPTSSPGVTAKVVSRSGGDGIGLPFCVTVSGGGAGREIDVTKPLVSAVAHAIWQARGGADGTNWADAEGVVRQLLGAQAVAAPASSIRNVNIPPPSSENMPGPLPAIPQPTRRTQSSSRR
jgi:hypothetical protein